MPLSEARYGGRLIPGVRIPLRRPEYTIPHDSINGSITSDHRPQIGAGGHTADYTVFAREPARAVVRAAYEVVVGRARGGGPGGGAVRDGQRRGPRFTMS